MTNGEWNGHRTSRDEQEKQGLLPVRRGNLVLPLPENKPTQIQQMGPHSVDLSVTHPATQEVIVTTSATDRARGFQMIITPISIVVGVLAVLVSLAFDNDFLTFWTFLLFWLVFCAVYVVGWVLTAVATPEFVSWYSARRQWNLIDREQKERWSHYRWQAGREEKRENLEIPLPFIYAGFGLVCLLSLTVGILYLLGW